MNKDQERELRIVHAMQACVHFTGIHRSPCKAGVNYRTLVGGPDLGWALRIPCTEKPRDEQANVVPCDQCRRVTREEAESKIQRQDEGYQRLVTCLTAIRKKHGRVRGLRDSMPCPNNCGGTLHYSIASSNGHIHGSCTTPGCAAWMQ